jgi:hypothetical protein
MIRIPRDPDSPQSPIPVVTQEQAPRQTMYAAALPQ